MRFNEADTRAKLIDPAIHRRGWTEDLIYREETAGSIEIIGGRGSARLWETLEFDWRTIPFMHSAVTLDDLTAVLLTIEWLSARLRTGPPAAAAGR